MYAGVFAILVYFMVVPGVCELGVYIHSKWGKKH